MKPTLILLNVTIRLCHIIFGSLIELSLLFYFVKSSFHTQYYWMPKRIVKTKRNIKTKIVSNQKKTLVFKIKANMMERIDNPTGYCKHLLNGITLEFLAIESIKLRVTIDQKCPFLGFQFPEWSHFNHNSLFLLFMMLIYHNSLLTSPCFSGSRWNLWL